MREYRKWFVIMVAFTILLYASGIILDACPAIRLWIKNHIINICLADKMDAMLGFYGIIWTVTTGTVVFVIQHGYGNVLGLSMIEILGMAFFEPVLVYTGALILCRAEVFLGVYLLEMKCTMVFGIAEMTMCLLFIGKCFFSLPQVKTVKEMIISNDDKITDKQNENILKVSKQMNYNDNEECEALIEILTLRTKQLQEVDWSLEAKWNKENAAVLIKQENIVNRVVENMYKALGDSHERMMYLMKMGLNSLSKESAYKKYAFVKSLLADSAFAIPPEEIIYMLQTIENGNRIQVLKKLIVYTGFLHIILDKNAWNKTVLTALYKEYAKYGETEETLKWEDSAEVFYMEYQRYGMEEKTDFPKMDNTMQMNKRYIDLTNEIKKLDNTKRRR